MPPSEHVASAPQSASVPLESVSAHVISVHVSAAPPNAPCVRKNSLAQPVVWLSVALLHVNVAPAALLVTATQPMHASAIPFTR
jgi:hypothetical protein